MSLNISPLDSEDGGTPRVRKKKADKKKTDVYKVYDDLNIEYNVDDMNLGLVNEARNTGFVPPEGLKSNGGLNGNGLFFPNAKPASMLEWGWKQAKRVEDFHKGKTGLLTIDDGPEMEVEVIEGFHRLPVPATQTHAFTTYAYTFREVGKEDSKPLELPLKDRYKKWDFYTATTPVPFIPRAQSRTRGGSRKRKVKKGRKTRKMRRKA